jgi:AmmeMemoRadiSam system protein B
MTVRQPARAGMFYDASPDACRAHAQRLVARADLPDDLPEPLYGGLVPHAGWVYSGTLAAKTLKAVLAGSPRRTVVLFGADHTGMVLQGEVYDAGAWRTPLGEVPVDEELAGEALAAAQHLRANPAAHAMEHSLEVQVPLIQVLAPDARILPIAVPPSRLAAPIGQAVGEILAGRGRDVCVIGSTDLTHHGGHFPAPGGRGAVGEQWTRRNDQRMIELIEAMDADGVVPEAGRHQNACGAGAVAATIAACRAMGAGRGLCLEYTNSYEIVHAADPDFPDDTTVGYASIVFA